MNEKKSSNKETRTRNWTIVVYPESAPENWRDIINDMHIEWIESPLHDSDYNGDGERKKEHWHILLMFGGVKTYAQVMELIEPLNCPIPQRCHNVKSMVRYMCHLDNPDKFQYPVSNIKSYGGVDISEMFRPSSSERYSLIGDMIRFIKDYNIFEFQDLMDYALEYESNTWFPLLCDNSTLVISQYIKSQRHRARPQAKIDPDTGEFKE